MPTISCKERNRPCLSEDIDGAIMAAAALYFSIDFFVLFLNFHISWESRYRVMVEIEKRDSPNM